MKIKLVVSLFILIFISSCSSDNKTIGLKQELQHDDYFYSIADVTKTEDIGGVKPQGVFYTVTFRVDNRAKRVEHPWNNSIAFVIDENGKEYQNLPDKQRALNQIKPFNFKDSHVTKAGETELTVFVFDLPKDVKQPFLKYNGEYLMGDMFDGNQFKKTKIKLF